MNYTVIVDEKKAIFEDLWQAMKWFFYNAEFKFTDSPSINYSDCELWHKDQLICFSGWNKKRYKISDWYGAEFIVCKNIPKFIKEQLIDSYIYYNIYRSIHPNHKETALKASHEETIKLLEKGFSFSELKPNRLIKEGTRDND